MIVLFCFWSGAWHIALKCECGCERLVLCLNKVSNSPLGLVNISKNPQADNNMRYCQILVVEVRSKSAVGVDPLTRFT